MYSEENIAVKGPEILIVEDSPTQAMGLELILKQNGYLTSVAANGREALARLSRKMPAMVISDILMPELDGFELCRAIREDERYKNIPVILLSFLSDAADVLKGLESGASNFIIKPYNPDRLISYVREKLSRRFEDEERPQPSVTVEYSGKRYTISSGAIQVLDILVSTYGTAVHKNEELIRAETELRFLNEGLEEKVRERTAALTSEIAERRRVEEELKSYSEELGRHRTELEFLVNERTAELVRANTELQQEIIERKRVEVLLQRQAELLHLSHDAIIVWQLGGRIESWNKGAEELYGYSKEEALGQLTHDLLKTIHPEPWLQIEANLRERKFWEGEFKHRTREREELIVSARLQLVRGEDGVERVLETTRDITERKLMEEELRKSRDDLELRVQERTTELSATVARLELVNAELQEFAFVASHDLQEPLRKIQTFCDMVQKRCAPVLDSTGKDYLDRVANSARRMRQLLRDLLDFSRVATRSEPFKKIDLAKIAREAADVFEASVKETGCQIEIEDMPAIEADETQMLGLFQNLIGNALKFRSAETPCIKVYGNPAGKRVCEIFVKDNGIGFDPKYAELIFKPFQRLHGRNEYDGTGMGLAICRKIVERHGGSIKAESKPGKGSTFIIRLPVKQDRWDGIGD